MSSQGSTLLVIVVVTCSFWLWEGGRRCAPCLEATKPAQSQAVGAGINRRALCKSEDACLIQSATSFPFRNKLKGALGHRALANEGNSEAQSDREHKILAEITPGGEAQLQTERADFVFRPLAVQLGAPSYGL